MSFRVEQQPATTSPAINENIVCCTLRPPVHSCTMQAYEFFNTILKSGQ
jgi:hypothetical protein